jgi:hypothetical protein
VRRWVKLSDERVTVEARQADLHECKSALEAGQAATMDHAEWQLPTFPRASQNVAAVAALLDTLPAPSIDGVGEVYRLLKNILDTTTMLQAESSLQYRVEASVLTLDNSKAGGQWAVQGALDAGTASSLARISAYDLLGHPSTRSEPQVRRHHCPGDDDTQSQQRV